MQTEIETGQTAPTLAPGEMRFAKKDLARAVTAALMVVEKRNTIAVLGTIRLRVAEGMAVVLATDLDIDVSVTIPAEGEGDKLMPPKVLAHVLKHGGPVVSITSDGDGSIVQSGDLTIRLRSHIEPEDWPDRKPFKGVRATMGQMGDLQRALRAALVSVSTEETRYYLNGVLFEQSDGGKLHLVSTDGHRMTMATVPACAWATTDKHIVPTKAVQIITRLFNPISNFTIEVDADGNPWMLVTAGNIALRFKSIDGTYPNYQRVIPVIPDPPAVRFSVSGDALAKLYLDGESNPAVSCDPAAGTMTIGKSCDVQTVLPLVGTGPEGKPIGFNLKYLRAFCPPGEAVTIYAAEPTKAQYASGYAYSGVRLVGADIDVIRVIMPMYV